jgi:hypothetical protein
VAGRGALWRESDFLKLWAGETVSLLGTQVSSLAIPLTAIGLLDAGPNQLGLLRTAQFLPFIVLTLLAGTWVDRRRRRPLMVAANLLRAALLLAVPLLAWADRLELWQLYGIVAVVGVGAVFFDLSYLSYLPSLVRREHLVEGNSKLAVSASVARGRRSRPGWAARAGPDRPGRRSGRTSPRPSACWPSGAGSPSRRRPGGRDWVASGVRSPKASGSSWPTPTCGPSPARRSPTTCSCSSPRRCSCSTPSSS